MESKAAVDGKSAECLLVFLTIVRVRGVMLTMVMLRMMLTMMMTLTTGVVMMKMLIRKEISRKYVQFYIMIMLSMIKRQAPW